MMAYGGYPYEDYMLEENNTQIPKASFEISENDLRDSVIIDVGKTGVGKSSFLKYIIHSYPDTYDFIVAYSPSARIKPDYNFLPIDCRREVYNPEEIWAILREQKKLIDKHGKEEVAHILIIIDDPIGTLDLHNVPELELIATSGKGMNIGLWLIVHHLRKVSPTITGQPSLMVLHYMSDKECKALMEEVKGFKNAQEFITFVDQHTKNFGALVFKNTNIDKDQWVHVKPPDRKSVV